MKPQLCALLSLVFAGSAVANIEIDPFQNDATISSLTRRSAPYYVTFDYTSIAGRMRMVGFSAVNSNPYRTRWNYDQSTGYSAFSQGAGFSSDTIDAYGYVSTSANTSTYTTFDMMLNLSSCSAFVLTVATDGATMPVGLELNNSAFKIANFTVNSSTTSRDYTIPFSQFTGVDFSQVHQIALLFNDPTGSDFVLTNFKAIAAPEPGTLFGLLLVSAGLMRRRRKAQV